MAASIAFEELVTRHEREVLSVCRSILRDDHLSRDAAQETFLRLWTRICDKRGPSQPAGWLRKVALSTALDIARRGSAHRDEALALEHDRATSAASAEETAFAGELTDRYEAALATLPEGQRTVFVLRHEGGLRLAEVAETLGVALPTVKTQFARACVKLQARLKPFAPDTPETD
jgi:RNA polymerase sigma-70 factor (ECF subfamily)